MKLNRIFLYALTAFMGFGFQACQQTEENIFDAPSAERLQGVLDNTKQTLMAAENGWVFDYYPDRNISYGSKVIFVKFDKMYVSALSESSSSTAEPEKTLYKLTNDNGPMLSFDDYNTILHADATPSSSKYEGRDGDFEFLIMDVKPELITLRGKRTGNTMYLRKLDGDGKKYLSDMRTMVKKFCFANYKGTADGKDITVDMDHSQRYIEFTWGETDDDYTYSYFAPTPTGIALLEPIKVNGVEITTVEFDSKTNTLSAKSADGKTVTATAVVNDDYALYSEYLGNYTLNFGTDKTVDITIAPTEDEDYFLIKGLLKDDLDLIAEYKRDKGWLLLTSQYLGSIGTSEYYVCATADGANFYTSDAVGMYLKKDVKNPGTFLFSDNGAVSGKKMIGFFTLEYADGWYYSPFKFANDDYTILNLTSIVKK